MRIVHAKALKLGLSEPLSVAFSSSELASGLLDSHLPVGSETRHVANKSVILRVFQRFFERRKPTDEGAMSKG
jgi:hypothetical protein